MKWENRSEMMTPRDISYRLANLKRPPPAAFLWNLITRQRLPKEVRVVANVAGVPKGSPRGFGYQIRLKKGWSFIKEETLAIEPRNLETAVDAVLTKPATTIGKKGIVIGEASLKKTPEAAVEARNTKKPDDIDNLSTGALDTALLSNAEFEFEDLHKLLLQRYQAEITNFSIASDKERQLTAEAQDENKKMEARIQELEQKILRQEGLKNQWMKIAGENHSDYVPKSVVHRDLDQKDLEIKAANDAFQAMKKSHDESFQTAMTLQGERDRAQKEVEDLERLVKEFTEEKANLLIKDLERKKELEDHELRLQNLQKQYDNLGKLVTRHCRVFFGEQHDLNNATPEECLGVLASKILDAAGGTLALMKNLSPDDQVPSSVGGILEILYKVPEVVDWTRRSACRRGATAALSILTSHYGEQVDLPCITGGYAPSASGRAASTVEIAAELTRCAPYADRVLSMVKLDIHQASQLAPKDKGKAPATSVDAAKVKLFAAAREGALTSYPGNDQVAREELQTHVKLPEDILGAFASSSS